MLDTIKTLKGYKLRASDGESGEVSEFYFDDKHWTIRYLVAETGNWLYGRQVQLSPYSLSTVNKDQKTISVNLTKTQIEESPSLEAHKPVSRQYEESYYSYYRWPTYWDGPSAWGQYAYPGQARDHWDTVRRSDNAWDPNLRSTKDVTGHNVEASNGEIGHVDDFVIEDDSWTIRYLIIDTRNWLPGKKVLISPQWIDRINWIDAKVYTSLSREAIERSPEYSEQVLLDREYESKLYGHYSRSGYWNEQTRL